MVESTDEASGESTDTAQPRRGIWIALAIVAALALAALLFVLFRSPAEEPTADQPVPSAESSTDAAETLAGQVGEALDVDPFVITITGAGEADLESLSVGAPPEGTYYYLVGVLFENRGETVSLDALPYSVDGSELEADGESVVGVLQVDFGSPITGGTIPAGEAVSMNFVFPVPTGSREFVFVWAPAFPEYPRIVVPLPDENP